jgi:DNA end-binding protein Ku
MRFISREGRSSLLSKIRTMPPRSSWKGYLKLSLVSVPVKAYTATSSSAQIHLNQLHDECHSRIKYQKTCPIHGEVSNDEIVSGYEFAKGQYVVIDPAEIEKLRTASDKSIAVDCFVSADEIDPVYHSGRTYYLVPDGPVGQKPYNLLRQGMGEASLHAVARVVISNREQLVLLRPIDNLLGMTVLSYDAEVKKAVAFEDEVTETEASPQEVELTHTLINALVREDFELAEYKDQYIERLTQLIESKVEGKELVTPPSAEEPHVINLMEALKASVQQVKTPAKAGAEAKPPKKMAASKKEPAARKTAQSAARKKRKSG